jgi:rare lipoprotein A
LSDFGDEGGYNMSSINRARASHDVSRTSHAAALMSAAGLRGVRLVALVLGAASLAACAQSSVVANKSELVSARQQTSLQQNRRISFATNDRVALMKKHTRFRKVQVAPLGIASFYTEGTRTASGETFDTHQLTAAHPTLPFGTRLRVTNVSSGRSVTVRVNDRGPFIPGRVVDVSYSAAETLGMVRGGIAKVRLDVVQ